MKNKIKITTFLLGLLVLQFVTMGFSCNVKQTTVGGTATVNCPPGPVGCGISVSGTVTVTIEDTDNFQQENTNISNGIYNIDLSSPWIPDASDSPKATLIVKDGSGQISQQQFNLQPVSSANFSAVDNQTTPYSFAFSDSSQVESFLNTSSYSSASGEREITMNYNFPVIHRTFEKCLRTGNYLNHVRFSDSSGITFITSPIIRYQGLTSANGLCNGNISVSN